MTSEAVGGTPLSVYVDQHRKVEGGPATPVYITNLAGAGPDPTGATDGFVWTADGVGGAGWEGVPGAVTPDVDDLTTTTGVANDMLRVGAGGGLVYRTPAETLGDIGAEPALGNPGTSGYLLSSTDGGVRSWVAPASGGLLAVNNLSDLTNTTTARDNLGVEIGADVAAWRPGYFWLNSMPAGYTGTFDSADVSAWRPNYFILYSMPTGYAGTFDSADVAAWRPNVFYLYSMPTGYTITAGGGFASWTTTSNFQMQSNGLPTGTVDAILWELYQASTVPRTASGGTINISGSNAAPSGTYQAAASCPVTVATPGKEVAHELKNDGCAVGFNKWSTVTTS